MLGALRSVGRLAGAASARAAGAAAAPASQARWYAVSAKNVKAIREQTGLSMKVIRQALEATGDDVEAALTWIDDNASDRGACVAVASVCPHRGLRLLLPRQERVPSKAQSKLGDRETSQGRIAAVVQGRAAGIAHIACETDFVARTDEVEALVAALAVACVPDADGAPAAGGVTAHDVDALLARPAEGAASTLADRVALSIAAVGENIVVRRVAGFAVGGSGVVGCYTHGVGAYVALVALANAGEGESAQRLADQIAQQVVAVDPGDGGVEALLSSPYLFDADRTVGDVVAAEAPGASVSGYLRWGLSDA